MNNICLKLNLKDIFKSSYKVFKYGRDDGFPYHGIWCFTGGQGTGKTLTLVNVLLRLQELYPNVLIVSNIHFNEIGYIWYMGIEDFDFYNNGTDGIIFVLDEIQVLYSSLKSKNMDESELFIWCQNRKNRRVILGSSQRFTRVAKPIRLYKCRFHLFLPPLLCHIHQRNVT